MFPTDFYFLNYRFISRKECSNKTNLCINQRVINEKAPKSQTENKNIFKLIRSWYSEIKGKEPVTRRLPSGPGTAGPDVGQQTLTGGLKPSYPAPTWGFPGTWPCSQPRLVSTKKRKEKLLPQFLNSKLGEWRGTPSHSHTLVDQLLLVYFTSIRSVGTTV